MQAKPQAPAPRRDALGLDIAAAAPAALIPGMDSASSSGSLDQLFGLSPSPGNDPLANSALDAPMAQPNTAADESDPLRALQLAPRASGAPVSDNLSDLHRPFIPPTTIKPAIAARGAPAGSDPAWVKTSLEGPPNAAPAAAPLQAPAAGNADSHALLQAFRRGLNVPTIELPSLTPALMELIGQLLHEAVRGTVDLLRARTTVKHEMRADVTRIVARNNNPLKFSPNAEVALQHLLSPPARGFIPAAPAMRDAYEDLRAHQFAFVAGMQAIMEAALQRFDPAALESQLGDRSLMHSLLPASRHARLWEMFGEHYARIRNEATSDFNASFGAAFLAAYDEHVKQLQERDARQAEA
jgi:FHA domain-containing protein